MTASSKRTQSIDQQFNVRPMRRNNTLEEEAVVSLVNRCYRSTESWTNESEIVQGLRVTRSQLRDALQDYEILVAEDNRTEKIMACLKTGVTSESVVGPMQEATGYIGMFAVAPEYQSQGIGSYMMSVAEMFCVEKGVSKMTLDVLGPRDDIIRWYNRCGYERTGESTEAGPVIERKGERLLVPCSFVLMQKDFST